MENTGFFVVIIKKEERIDKLEKEDNKLQFIDIELKIFYFILFYFFNIAR
jgi:hypothetical protein